MAQGIEMVVPLLASGHEYDIDSPPLMVTSDTQTTLAMCMHVYSDGFYCVYVYARMGYS